MGFGLCVGDPYSPRSESPACPGTSAACQGSRRFGGTSSRAAAARRSSSLSELARVFFHLFPSVNMYQCVKLSPDRWPLDSNGICNHRGRQSCGTRTVCSSSACQQHRLMLKSFCSGLFWKAFLKGDFGRVVYGCLFGCMFCSRNHCWVR